MDLSLLKKAPFHLDESQLAWVRQTLSGMTLEQKVGQLFCVNALNCPETIFHDIFGILEPGGVMYRATPMETTTAFTRKLSENAKIPLLISGNLEKGGNGMIPGGTQLGSPMAVAATGETEMAAKLGTVCAREGRSIGANWAFAPIIDIDYNWHNPITNTRTFGSDPQVVAAMGAAYVRSVQANGVAACIKHFPGDGRDERDQHLLTSVNDLDCETWMETYGAVYKACIEAGALTCMAGVQSGVITPERLDEAVTRILGVKAALGLHTERPMPTVEEAREVVGCAEHRAWAQECADKSITLVKEEAGVLPITPEKFPRILLYPMEAHSEATAGNYGVRGGVIESLAERLRKEGFTVTMYERDPSLEGFTRTMRSYQENCDLCLYVANIATKSNQTVVRLEWAQPMGANCPHFITSIPTIFVSLENPYHLADVPRIRTFINTYSSSDVTLDLLVEKLTGRSPFRGVSPSDPFCGLWDTHL